MKVAVKSKMKPKKKKQVPSEAGNDNSVKKKKKYRKRTKFIKKAFLLDLVPSTGKMTPPNDANSFSANWKALQEIMKSSQTNEPKTSQRQPNGPLQEEKYKPSQNAHQNSTSNAKAYSGQKNKHKSVDTKAINAHQNHTSNAKTNSGQKHKSVDSKANSHVVSDTKQPAAAKRKNKLKANGEQAAKKQKVEAKESKPTAEDIWFDDVDPDDIEATVGAAAADIMRKRQGVQKNERTLVKENAFEGLTKVVAIDCEMVGVGLDGEESILARVSLVNHFGKCVYDKYVKPSEKVTDYRTAVSGIRPHDIQNGEDVATVRKEVAEILHGRTVVGHALHNDFKILLLDHPKKKIRDTQKYKPFRKTVKTNRPSLKLLCKEILNVNVQQGEHSSVQDAQATMRLYTLMKKQWEADIKISAEEKREKRKPKAPKDANKHRVTGLSA